MFGLLTILASLLAPLSPVTAKPDRPAGLLSDKDYPAEAIKKREQGIVRARLRISAEGRVMACAIIQSAGRSLDVATCRILTQRARFTPKLDSNGKAIESDYETPPIRWMLPGKPSPQHGARR